MTQVQVGLTNIYLLLSQHIHEQCLRLGDTAAHHGMGHSEAATKQHTPAEAAFASGTD